MFRRAIHFIKYHNAALLILVAIFLLGTAAFATETGQAALGQKETRVEGIDNTLLLAADLDNLDMDYKIERIESDEKYYYVTYTYIDLVRNDDTWEYQMQEKLRRVSKKLKKDLGIYLTEELIEEYEARIKDLKQAQERESANGESTRVEITEYTGLIGTTLDITGRIFPDYEPVTIQALPSPELPYTLIAQSQLTAESIGEPDDLTQVYLDYINGNDPDEDGVFGIIDNCPDLRNPDQADSDGDGIGDACDFSNDAPLVDAADGASDDLTEVNDTTTGSEEITIDESDVVTATGTDDSLESEESVPEEEPVIDPAEEIDIEPDVEIIELPAEYETAASST